MLFYDSDTGAMLYQLSYEATHWERGQFVELFRIYITSFHSSRENMNSTS